MALRVLRMDKRQEERAAEIAKDWRAWAVANGYSQRETIPLQQGKMAITLEIWERPLALGDAYLFYHPEVPTTVDTEVLYIMNDREKLERIMAISQHMANDLMRRVQMLAETLKGNIPKREMNGHEQDAQEDS